MKGGIIYFSGTGNTKYVASEFKKALNKNDVNCDLIDIVKTKELKDYYNFYVLGCPIYAEMFPYYFMNWVKDNLDNGNGRKVIIFSTQASNRGTGTEELRVVLEKRGFKVTINQPIKMPNNYYVVGFNRTTENENNAMCKNASEKVNDIVKKFLLGETSISSISTFDLKIGKIAYKFFDKYSKKWAKKTISVDYTKCLKCKKCQDNCPTNNIIVNEKIEFKSNCISCQRCIHICPSNAFLYKGKHFDQYKLNDIL
ncbi:EFR1 family ferrodoxin [Haloimpatiens sp. FM7315]|uniref:EFR1 family ferrodoxin n=1 Tax=Haloimpatiens sp. FM7315 TaxID=3298609 RepID=UPI0035A282A1